LTINLGKFGGFLRDTISRRESTMASPTASSFSVAREMKHRPTTSPTSGTNATDSTGRLFRADGNPMKMNPGSPKSPPGGRNTIPEILVTNDPESGFERTEVWKSYPL